MKKAVVTVTMGEAFERLARITHPTIQAYADRIGAEFVVLRERRFPQASESWEKLHLRHLLEIYDRIIFLDTDLIVRPDTPDLFGLVPEESFAALVEGRWIPRKDTIETGMHAYGRALPGLGKDWHDSQYFNAGVMVFSRRHRGVFADPPNFTDNFYEQTWLNIQAVRERVTFQELPAAYNRMSIFDAVTKDHRLEAYIIHYAGTSQGNGYARELRQAGSLEELIRADLKAWRTKAHDYHVRKQIVVNVGGGLGDHADAEPVIREMRALYPKDRLIVASHWPELFENLDYEVESVRIGEFFPPKDVYATFITYARTDAPSWQYLSPVFSHCTDYASQLSIRRVLPPEKKEIRLRYTGRELDSMLKKTGVTADWLRDAVVVHPGRSWPTKTVRAETWTGVLEHCARRKIPTVVIGKDSSGGQGLVPLRPLPDGIVDARDILGVKETLALLDHAKVLVTNDSAPLHLAGATDITIIGIFSAKHPSLVWPYRRAPDGTITQAHKTIEAGRFRRPSCFPCNHEAVPTTVDVVTADRCSRTDEKYVCHASAEELIRDIERTLDAVST
jgi:hypothetical protein